MGIADRPVEFSIRAKLYPPAVVVVRSGHVINQNFVQDTGRGFRIISKTYESVHEPPVGGAIGIGDIDIGLFMELGIERQPERPGFGHCRNIQRHPRMRL